MNTQKTGRTALMMGIKILMLEHGKKPTPVALDELSEETASLVRQKQVELAIGIVKRLARPSDRVALAVRILAASRTHRVTSELRYEISFRGSSRVQLRFAQATLDLIQSCRRETAANPKQARQIGGRAKELLVDGLMWANLALNKLQNAKMTRPNKTLYRQIQETRDKIEQLADLARRGELFAPPVNTVRAATPERFGALAN